MRISDFEFRFDRSGLIAVNWNFGETKFEIRNPHSEITPWFCLLA